MDDVTIPLPSGAALCPLAHPARADAGPSARVLAYAEVRNACLTESTGRDDEHFTADELLPLLAPIAYEGAWKKTLD